MQTLRKQYYSLYPPHLIKLAIEPSLSLAQNQAWIYDQLLSPESIAGSYPPADDYQRKFWKLVIAALDEQLNRDEAVMEELVSSPGASLVYTLNTD
jgi:hypothetical protein